jgi:predicted nucleic acid-binding protein
VLVPVVDATVVVDWVAPGIDREASAIAVLARWASVGEEVLAPRLLMEEVSNALLTGIRRRRWSGADADTAWALLGSLPVRLADDGRDLVRAWDLARRYDNAPLYDMVYVALAERLRMPLVTTDAALRSRLVGVDWLVGPEDVLGI